MRFVYSYIRLTIASWMFLGGVAVQFFPSAGGVEREARHRERMLQSVPADERAEWLRLRDRDDAQAEAYLRLAGVMIGGVGFAMALFEAAYVCARSSRHCPLDTT
jgi:hypothetical protein